MSNKNRNFSLVALRKEKKKGDAALEPFVLELEEGVEVTFANPITEGSARAIIALNSGDLSGIDSLFKKILSDEDYEKYNEYDPTMEEFSEVLAALMNYYAEENEASSKS